MNGTLSTVPASGTRRALFRNRSFLLLWTGQGISNVGDVVFDTTLMLWIATTMLPGYSWAPLGLSGVLVAAVLPMLLIGPVAGTFVDRWEKRRTMLVADASRALLILLLVLLTLAAPLGANAGTGAVAFHLGTVYAIVFLAGAVSQFFTPARLVLMNDIVSEAARPQAVAMGQLTQALAIVIGPAIASVLLFSAGVAWALLVNALSFAASFAAILAVRPAAPEHAVGQHEAWQREFADGLRFFASDRTLRTIAVAVCIAMAGAGALSGLNIFFVTENLQASPRLYSLAGAIVGAGSIAGAVLASLTVGRLGLSRMLWASMVLTGCLVVLYSRLTSLAPALAVLFVLSMPNVAVNVVISPLMLRVTPRHMMGRVASVLNPAIGVANVAALAGAGLLASTVLSNFHARLLGLRFGPVDTIFTGAGLLVIVGGLYAAYQQLDRPRTVGAAGRARAAMTSEAPRPLPQQQVG